MSLTLQLGKRLPGDELAETVRNCMKELRGFTFKEKTGVYAGEARLVPGYTYFDGLTADEPEPYTEEEQALIDSGVVEESKRLPYHGKVAIHKRTAKGHSILEVSRPNNHYRLAVDNANKGGSILFNPIITGVRALTLLAQRAIMPRSEGYPEITYNDSIFTEIEEKEPYESICFHINALDPEYGGGLVRDMDDTHFRNMVDQFSHLCLEICRDLSIIPTEPALDSLYLTTSSGNP